MQKEENWFNTICESYTNPPVSYKGRDLPAFPSDEIQANTTGASGRTTLKEAFVFYQDCVDVYESIGHRLDANTKVLDFGIGWGRVARFFLEHLPLENVHGIDVTPDFVEICRSTFQSRNFTVCNALPPSGLEEESFDLIFGYSVFSHLSEAACQAWMDEFAKLLKPNGVLALTTRGRPFFDYCESLKGTDLGPYSKALSNLFVDFDDARSRYDNGEFVHSNIDGVNGGGAMSSDFYGETFIPEHYAENQFNENLELVRFMFHPSRQTHPIMFFQNRSAG